ncbi:MAG: winged helix-turn-helix transcriptional regulator [Clostridia bacterium]|nr:winged helix-turn-helix transcriptional regulator [Clostridia bacterium]
MSNFSLPHHHSDESDAESIKKTLDNIENFNKVADIFKQLGDSSRLRIFCLLCHREECVIDIAAMVDMTTPAVSHHLKQLKSSGLITGRRDGKEVYYKASDTIEAEYLHKTVDKVMDITCPGRTDIL